MANIFLVTGKMIRNKVTSPENAYVLRKPFNSYIPLFKFDSILVAAQFKLI